MIAWSIEAALGSGLFDEVVVSTDDEEIADVARSFRAKIPFMRPAELSDDRTGTTAVVAHAVRELQAAGAQLDDDRSAVCCIYATAPLVRTGDLSDALARLEAGPFAYVFSACEYASPIFRSFRATGEGLEMFFPEHFATRSQDLPTALHDAGQFYWGRPSAWLNEVVIFSRHSSPLVIPRWRVQDIDDEDDWKRAELLHMLLERAGDPRP